MPAIASEGRALFEAVTGQGLFGVRARQRASPYLPGVRSRLWRSIAINGSSAGDALLSGALPQEDAITLGEPGERRERVLALIRRLPLDFEDDPGG